MRFHLIDRIEAWDAGRQITARKVAAAAEDFWYLDRTGRLLMPSELVLEAVCQAATWLIMLGSGLRTRAVLLSIDEMVCTGEVVPGDVLAVTATITSLTGDAALVDGGVQVDGRAVLHATGIMCALRDAETLDARDNTERLASQLLRSGDPR
jgi:3-hydroxyacyl-[acyl-carrier-protein] dehydratase